MRTKTTIVVCSLLIGAACSPQPQVRELSNPSVNALMSLEVPRFFATLRLANELALDCARYSFDEAGARAISEARTRNEAGRFTAIQNSAAITMESDVTLRSFEAKHVGRTACEALDIEVAQQSAISAVISPA